jgi:hypothetical protein
VATASVTTSRLCSTVRALKAISNFGNRFLFRRFFQNSEPVAQNRQHLMSTCRW